MGTATWFCSEKQRVVQTRRANLLDEGRLQVHDSKSPQRGQIGRLTTAVAIATKPVRVVGRAALNSTGK
jgi:hypothetical protein